MNKKIITSVVVSAALVASLSGCSNSGPASEAASTPTPSPTPTTLCGQYSESITWLEDKVAADGDLNHLDGFFYSGFASDIHDLEPDVDIDFDGTYRVQPSKFWVEYIKLFGKCMDKPLKDAVIDVTASEILNGN